jgi:biotin carboxyl carrier protein
MKMQNEIKAPGNGIITRTFVAEGQTLESQAPLIEMSLV